MAKRAPKATKTYTLLYNWSGNEFSAHFLFNATDDRDAASKAFGWSRYHSLTHTMVSSREATADDLTRTEFHNEWMR